MGRVSVAIVVLLAVAFGASPASASVYVLTPGNINDLSTFLGEGPLSLTSIFSKEAGDTNTATTFHAAVDGQGRTFTVIQATPVGGGVAQLFGGYNPVSWDSSVEVHVNPTDAGRTAFLFNLDTSTMQAQKPEALAGGDGDPGRYQTRNFFTTLSADAEPVVVQIPVGPTFGLYDIYYPDPSLETLGYLYQHAYGGLGQGGSCLAPGSCWPTSWNVAGFQVYTIAPAAPAEVPEPASLFLMGTGVLGLIEYRRRQRQQAVGGRQ